MTKPLPFKAREADLTPEDIADLLPSRPIVSSSPLGWPGVVLQRYQHPPSVVDLSPVRDNIVVLNLAGPTLVEDTLHDGSRLRRWTDSGHMSLTPAAEPVSRKLKGRPDVLLLHITSDLVREVAQEVFGEDPGPRALSARLAVPDAMINQIGRLLLAEAVQAANVPGTSLVANMLTRSLIVQLLRCHTDHAPVSVPAAPSLASTRLERVLQHMRTHLDEPLKLNTLAEMGGSKPSRFARAFREAVGESPHQHLIRLRIRRARDLLETSDLPVIQVALDCGFAQPTHFATMFRKATGMSPRTWRAERRDRGSAQV